MSILTVFLALSSAPAQTCDTKTLTRSLEEASPMSVPVAFHALYVCEPEAASVLASAALSRALPGDEANQMLLDAIDLGLADEVRAWIGELRSDERSSTLSGLGVACIQHQSVADFLVETEAVIGQAFWTQRWYRSLAECRRPEVQALLKTEVQEPSGDRSRFLSVLEVFARNLGAEAIPYLKTLLILNEGQENATYIVNAFADAAHVGSLEGVNEATAVLAVAALLEMAPQFSPAALKQAAITLASLGIGDRVGELAGAHFDQRRWADGQLHYGVVVVEQATCKKGKIEVVLHNAEVIEGGRAWIADLDVSGAVGDWSYTLQRDCKGTESTTTVRLSVEPLIDAQDVEMFQRAIASEVAGGAPAKVVVVEEAPLTF